jgi:outer membrane protein assembly factor BamB
VGDLYCLWKTSVAEGYAGAAIRDGRLYLNDYDAQKKEHLVRCISMADGKDLWTWSYPVEIRSNRVQAGYRPGDTRFG